jgi:hypothetical protein
MPPWSQEAGLHGEPLAEAALSTPLPQRLNYPRPGFSGRRAARVRVKKERKEREIKPT